MNNLKTQYYEWLEKQYMYTAATKKTYHSLISKIDLDHLESYLLECRAVDKDATFNLRITALRSFAIWLREEYPEHELIQKVEKLKSISSPHKESHKPYTQVEVRNILDVAKGWRRTALYIALYAGLRQQEIQSLNLNDIDLQNRIIRVRRGKGRKYREVAMPQTLVSVLERHLLLRESQGTESDALLITNRGTRAVLKSGGTLKALSEEVGFIISWHRCRATYATTLYKKSLDPKLVQQQLGHTSLDTTDRYIHMLTDERVNKMQDIGDIYHD